MPRKLKKPKKPTADFALWPHPVGMWAKKVRGKLRYFGPVHDSKGILTDAEMAQAALNKYLDQKDDLQAGRTPRQHENELTVKALVNRFLTSKKSLMDSGELSPRTWNDYYATGEKLIETLGRDAAIVELAGQDFERLRSKLAKVRGPVSLGNEIQRIRSVFKFAFDEGIIDKPVRFGATFKKPTRKAIRQARHAAGPRLLEAEDLQKLLKAASVQMRAMILLGLNAGFGQSDVAALPIAAVDLAGGWVNYPRPKTGIGRRCPLWPETVKALRAAIATRPEPKLPEDAGLVFVTKYGARWVRVKEHEGKASVVVDSVRLEFVKLLREFKLNRRGLGFYALRHIFRTIADGAKDQPAVNAIMGHVDESMADLYRERIDDKRLKDVTDHVLKWLNAK